MVRRALQVGAAVAVVFSSATGCSSDHKDDPKAVRALCATREQTQALVSAGSNTTVEQYPAVVEGLAAAVEVAPASIRPDFVLVHDTLKPFVDALVKAGGDPNVAAQDPTFAALATAVRRKQATEAGKRITDYYAAHCKKD